MCNVGSTAVALVEVRMLTFFFLIALELSDAIVYEPYIRALHGTASQLCEVVVLKLRTVPKGTTLSYIILRMIRRGIRDVDACLPGDPRHPCDC